MNPETYFQLDRVIHERSRLALVSLLAASEPLSFTDLRDTLGMSDGNLTTHLRTLEEAGYLTVARHAGETRRHTDFRLSPAGRTAFEAYLQQLEQIVRENRPPR
ncbi:MAG: transcriptional regulator [Verrucomicrobiota bacterium]